MHLSPAHGAKTVRRLCVDRSATNVTNIVARSAKDRVPSADNSVTVSRRAVNRLSTPGELRLMGR